MHQEKEVNKESLVLQVQLVNVEVMGDQEVEGLQVHLEKEAFLGCQDVMEPEEKLVKEVLLESKDREVYLVYLAPQEQQVNQELLDVMEHRVSQGNKDRGVNLERQGYLVSEGKQVKLAEMVFVVNQELQDKMEYVESQVLGENLDRQAPLVLEVCLEKGGQMDQLELLGNKES